MLWYMKFCKDLEEIGFDFNPYNPCITNCIVKKTQQTIRFHIDNLMSSHAEKIVNTEFLEWTTRKYGKHGEVKSTQGSKHDFLEMEFEFKKNGTVNVDMTKYMKKMVNAFEKKDVLSKAAPTPASTDLFANDEKSPKIDKEMKEDFHMFVAHSLFACKRARPDTATAILILTT